MANLFTISGFSGSQFTHVTPDFTLSLIGPTPAGLAGSSIVYPLQMTSAGAFDGRVFLSVSGLPIGATGSFSFPSILGAGLTTLSVVTPSNLAPGSYLFGVNYSYGTTTKTLPLTLTLTGQVSSPTFSPTAGTYSGTPSVSIATPTPGASIRYTTDGSTPSETAGAPYSGPITVSATTTIKAIAYESGMTDSSVASATYTINISSSNTAQFVRADITSQGSWKGVYGSDGYNVIEDMTSYPNYVTVAPSGQSNFIWSSSLGQTRALQKAESSTDRIAATWYSGGSFSLDVNFNDGAVHQIAMYFLDWDGGRTQTVAIQDATTQNVLDTRNLTSFYNGEYLVWNLSGHVTVVFTQTGAFNAVVSGLFFDRQAPVATPTFSPLPGNYIPAQTVSLTTTTSGASIRYTTDGSTPSETVGTPYSAPITISATTTINAVAYESGMPDSALASATYTITGPAWYSTSWTDRKSITIDHTKVTGSSNLTNFPVLVSVTDANLATVANGGYVGLPDGSDILFTASDGVTKLAHEIESYNANTGLMIAWVNVPTVSPTGDAVIYIYYGNSSAANQQNAPGTWNANFEGVWHLPNGTTLNADDSTSNANNASLLNGTSAATGFIDGSASLNGTSNFILVPNSASLNNWSQQTVSLWMKAQTDMGGAARLIEKGANNEWSLVFNWGGNQQLTVDLGTSSPAVTTTGVVADNNWHKIDVTMDNNTQAVAIYVDGVLNNSAIAPTSAAATNHDLSIGQYGGGGYYYHGLIDELEISNTVRSPAWIGAQYNNQYSSASFISVGSQESSGVPPPVASPTFSPAAGTYTSTQTVTISTATSGASIRYTTDGSAPSETAGTVYSAPITVSSTETVKAIAYESGMTDSAVASATYTISVATPTFSPGAGTYTSAQTVTISTATSGASIRYTTDGSTPSETAGTVYSAPITVSSTETVKAIAYESGMTDSSVASVVYTFVGWYNTSWTDRKSITIDHTKVTGSSNLTNFPVLVSVTDANLATVANGGYVGLPDGSDILFTASDGVTKLAHEIESYNANTGLMIAWVNVPTVSPTGDAVIYIYYGNSSAANQQNAPGTWNANFEGVWHLPNGTTLNADDSTSNANNASLLNGTSAATGFIDGSASLNGTSNFILVPNSASLNNWSQQTVSLWVNAQTDMGSDARLIEKGANNEWALVFNYGGSQKLSLDLGSVGVDHHRSRRG